MGKELNADVGRRVRLARDAAGLTQEKLAALIEVSVQFVSDFERGKVGASVETIVGISRALHVSCDYLLLGKEDSTKPGFLIRLEGLSSNQLDIVEKNINLLLEAFDCE
ncbi:MAG: helix-turn-helix transcriptional regulator [Clostridiales bacterium]|nr:helix-turn-helix transcriptional regulator [Clostridiales bacterium]